MRLSLRTLLAFEDNVFDVEQHRRLESLLPTDKDAESLLHRIRSVVRNDTLGVPGLVDQQEELDPNYVAEYLDHQMSGDVQEKFEAYCLSADKYLAEVASIHHILSNVLGEPARTSRECRFRCYEVLGSKPASMAPKTSNLPALEKLKHFRPFEEPADGLAAGGRRQAAEPFWKRWFPGKSVPNTLPEQTPAQRTTPQRTPLWSFSILGLCIVALLLGWREIETRRALQQLQETTVAESVDEPVDFDDFDVGFYAESIAGVPAQLEPAPLEPAQWDAWEPEPIEQVALTEEIPYPVEASAADPFAVAMDVDSPHVAHNVELSVETDNGVQAEFFESEIAEFSDGRESVRRPEEPMIAFQPVSSSTKIPAGVPTRQYSRPPLPVSAWQSQEEPVREARTVPESIPVASVNPLANPSPLPQPITQASGTVPRSLGRALPMREPSVLFAAATVQAAWRLPALPFDVTAEQYLLTASPFRGMFELADAFQIEMIGDTKLCVLPLGPSGMPGIYIDYGRIIIRPLQGNQSLRIETEKSQGIVSVPGTESLLFVDTFAEITDAPERVEPTETRKKQKPIIGFIPANGERIIWRSLNQSQPFIVESQGSVLLQSDQYLFGEIRRLSNWLGPMPMSLKDVQLAEACQRYFVAAKGDGERALTMMVMDESADVRALGLRLWGDLGRFDVPLSVLAAKEPKDELVRPVLGRYINEVMRRDAETVQRLADEIEAMKESGVRR